MTPSVSVDEELDELLQAPSASGPASARAAPAATPGHFLRNISDPFREIWCRHSPGQGRRTFADASPARLLDWVLPVDPFGPARGSVAVSHRTGGMAPAPCADATRMRNGPDTGHYTGGFGAQLDPSVSSLSAAGVWSSTTSCQGLEQYYVIASVSIRSPGGKSPPGFDSLPWGEDAVSRDFRARPTRRGPENRAVPGVRPPCAPAGLLRLSGHELTSIGESDHEFLAA
jgi:hypothetical protein